MGAKAEISWKGRTAEGLKREGYARRVAICCAGKTLRPVATTRASTAGRLAGVAGRGPASSSAPPVAAGGAGAREETHSRIVSGSGSTMKSRPLVLITPCAERKGAEFSDPSLSLSDRYPRAIIAAGGMPWVLPCWPAENIVAGAVRRCDGVMLTGGDDVQPKLYVNGLPPRLGQTVSPADPARDLWELLLIREVFSRRKPMLAICRGQQILNVALGGTLIIDIPRQVPRALNHRRLDRKNKIVH